MALKTIDLGPVSSYAIAVEKGYTGTEQEWYDLIHSVTDNAQTASDAAVSAGQSAASAAQSLVDIGTEKAAAIAEIQQEGADQKSDVTAEGAAQIANVDAAKDLAVAAVQAQQGTSVQAVYNKGVEQIAAVGTAGTTQIGLVQAEGATQIAAVEAKGEEVIESIPEDYSDLTAEVGDLKSALTNEDGLINALHSTINYGYDNPVNKTFNTLSGTLKRNTVRVEVNGSSSSTSTSLRLALNSPELTSYSSTPPTSISEYAVKLTAGHKYRIRTHYVSGTTTNNVDGNFSKLGATTFLGTLSVDPLTGDYISDWTYNTTDAPNGVHIALVLKRAGNGITLDKYTVDVTLEDITDGANNQIYTNVAPADLETATANHAVGELIICKNQLYEVTAAIAAGETITPGTNVSTTTIAAQLAAIKAQLANN